MLVHLPTQAEILRKNFVNLVGQTDQPPLVAGRVSCNIFRKLLLRPEIRRNFRRSNN